MYKILVNQNQNQNQNQKLKELEIFFKICYFCFN